MKRSIKNKLLSLMVSQVLKEAFIYFLLLPIAINFFCSYLGSTLIDASQNTTEVKDFLSAGYPPLIYIMFVVLACFVIPFVEEVLFRKWLWSFTGRFVGSSHTLWLTSVLFAFLHGGWYGFVLLPFAFYLGYIRRTYGSFKYSTVPHIVFNLTGVILTLGGI
jgi:membrane protease YdiL (CAAX protease family)